MKLKKTFVAMLSCVMAGSMCFAAENVLPDSLMPITANAAESYGDLSYKNHDTYIEISDCNESATSVVIPEEIDGLPVTMIGECAFSGCYELTSITIPDSVTSIGYMAFSGCSGLTSITIPDSITYIGNMVFNRSGLTSITIPDGVTSIGDATFIDCHSLNSIKIPDSVTSIRNMAFFNCFYLTSITIPPSVTEIGDRALGYTTTDEKIDSFTIYGTPSTAAEKYALENGFAFIDVNNTSTITMGDVNSDGAIDALDASDILIEYASVATGKGSNFDEAQIKAADLNNDGAVDALDASTVLIYYAYTATGGTETIEEFLMA